MNKQGILEFCVSASKGLMLRRIMDKEWASTIPPDVFDLCKRIIAYTKFSNAIVASPMLRMKFYAFVLKPVEPLPFDYDAFVEVCYSNCQGRG